MKFIIKPEDEKSPGKIVADEMYPDTHTGLLSSWISMGPKKVLSKFKLGALSSDSIQISSDTYAPGGFSIAHSHPERDQAYYIVKGEALVEIGGEKRRVGAGAMAFIPANVTHSFRNVGKLDLTLLVISSYLPE